MQVRTTASVRKGDRLRKTVRDKLAVALAKFSERIERVDVRLEDVNGPRGGIDKRCMLAARIRSGDVIQAEVVDFDYEVAIHRAVQRLTRRINDHLARRRSVRRNLLRY